MKQRLEIEDLIAAEQRHQADLRRQQQLSDLIDQLAAAETKAVATGAKTANKTTAKIAENESRRRPIWFWFSAAACLLLLVTIGLRHLTSRPADTPAPTILASTDTPAAPIVDTIPATTTPQTLTPSTSAPLLASLPTTNTKPEASAPTEKTEEEPVIPKPPLEIETPVFSNPSSPQSLLAEAPKVFERTSNRLVATTGNATQRNLRQPSPEPETQPLAFFTPKGTSALFDLAKIPF